MINLNKVSKQFQSAVIFNEIDLKIEHAGIHMILGESGSGKSTLLNMLAGYEPVSSGEIVKEGVMATIFQNYELIPELTVRDNIYIAPEIKHLSIKNEEVILSLLGLNELMQYYPNELSGGQRQRVGIARALFQEPSIILCDEPTESLDRENKQIVMQLLVELSKECIVIIASHDRKIIDQYADIIYRIENKKIVSEVIHPLEVRVKEVSNHPVDKKQVDHYLKKVLWKKTLLFSFVIALLAAITLTLFCVEKSVFQPFKTFDSITKDRIYVRSKTKNYSFDELGFSATPLIEFDSIIHENENYRFLAVPYIENEFEMEGKAPKGMEAVINQNAAKRLGVDVIGDVVTFKYRIGVRYERIDMVITGIVQEKDIEREVIYYDQIAFNNYLLEQIEDGNTSQFEIFKDSASYFAINQKFNQIDNAYRVFKSKSNLMLESPLYDEREAEGRKKEVYQRTFQIVEILLILGLIITVGIYSVLDTKKYMRNCSIFITLGASVELVKRVYLMTKIGIFTVLYASLILLQQVIYYFVSDYRLASSEYLIAGGMVALVYLVFVFFIGISIHRLKEERINTLLKDGQDL